MPVSPPSPRFAFAPSGTLEWPAIVFSSGPCVSLLLAICGCSATRSPPAAGTPPVAADARNVIVPDASDPGTPVADASSGTLTCVPAQRTITVAADGSGTYTTIIAALDSVPIGNRMPTLVSIRNGVYHERFVLRGKGFITLRGEDRALTRIEAEVATSTVCATADDGMGCSVLYLEAQDIAFDNLTIANTWAGSGKALALRTAAASTHIVLRDVDLPGKGGDTLVLERNGEYYLSRVSISGTYHIIVPRGTTWVSDSAFTCIGHPTCLFNEGILSEAQKLVIRNSTIGGTQPFGLGSYFRDAAWYFIDVTFSPSLIDVPIHRDPQDAYVVQWGERIYFAGSIGPDYAWLKDNIAASSGGSTEGVALAAVFPSWNPGSSLVCPP